VEPYRARRADALIDIGQRLWITELILNFLAAGSDPDPAKHAVTYRNSVAIAARYRWFESGFLQRRVSNELVPGPLSPTCVGIGKNRTSRWYKPWKVQGISSILATFGLASVTEMGAGRASAERALAPIQDTRRRTAQRMERHRIGSLLLGYFAADGELIYAGRVGPGMPVAELEWQRLGLLARTLD
jgi:hypothetical protein